MSDTSEQRVYPAEHSPKAQYNAWAAAHPPTMAFTGRAHRAAAWQTELRLQLLACLGEMPEPCDLQPQLIDEVDAGDHTRQKWLLHTEAHFRLPLYLLLPKNLTVPVPAVVAVHGHGPGKVHSAGLPNAPEIDDALKNELMYGLEAVRRGYIALCHDMRGFGECIDEDHRHIAHGASCMYSAGRSLMLGRTLLGERLWDVRRAIDFLVAHPKVNRERIACIGHSGGGTVTLMTAALEPRLRAAVVSAYLCAWSESLYGIGHCPCNYVPGLARLADCGDIGALAAPLPLLITAGASDPIFPLTGVKRAFATVSDGYAALGAADHAELYVGAGEHRFFNAPTWPFLEHWLRA